MEEMASLLCYQETMDEMRQKLMYTNQELENLKMETSEERRKTKEHVDQLNQLLKMAYEERDEARDQIQRLVNKIDSSPIVKAATTKANSSITESNSLSETFNSSPVDSFFDSVSSPEFSNKNFVESNVVAYVNHESFLPQTVPKFVQTSLVTGNGFPQTAPKFDQASMRIDNYIPQMAPKFDQTSLVTNSSIHRMAPKFDQTSLAIDNCINQTAPKFDQTSLVTDNSLHRLAPDHASIVIDSLVKGKPLPQQGKLLQAVLEAGPLLQTLLVSGQLPRWRNPPQLKPFSIIPPVSIKGCEANQNFGGESLMSCGSSQMLSSTSKLNFANFAPVSCLGNQGLVSAGANVNSFVHLNKRQRLI